MKFNKVITGNYFDKHTTNNPFYKIFITRYRKALQQTIADKAFTKVLEVGSGEGHIVSYVNEVKKDLTLIASDIDLELIKNSQKINPRAGWVVCLGETLPFAAKSYDLVLVCEVLEHVCDPAIVMREISRVGRGWLIATVPFEPWWRILNVFRLKYLKHLGNTPGHIQHWSLKSFQKFIGEYCDLCSVFLVFPWIFIVGKIKSE